MVNREHIKSRIDSLPEDIVSRIGEIIEFSDPTDSIHDYNKKTQKAIREAHLKPHKSKAFKSAEDLFKDLGI